MAHYSCDVLFEVLVTAGIPVPLRPSGVYYTKAQLARLRFLPDLRADTRALDVRFIPSEKRCTQCDVWLPISAYRPIRADNPDLRACCEPCRHGKRVTARAVTTETALRQQVAALEARLAALEARNGAPSAACDGACLDDALCPAATTEGGA